MAGGRRRMYNSTAMEECKRQCQLPTESIHEVHCTLPRGVTPPSGQKNCSPANEKLQMHPRATYVFVLLFSYLLLCASLGNK